MIKLIKICYFLILLNSCSYKNLGIKYFNRKNLDVRVTKKWENFVNDSYQQVIDINAAHPFDFSKLKITLPKLYDDAQLALMWRWDDNEQEGRIYFKELLAHYGLKATWYVNDIDASLNEHDTDQLLQNGQEMGGHTLSHFFLPYQNKNRIFREMLELKVKRESLSNKLINSFAFPFEVFQSPEGLVLEKDLYALLGRSAHIHVPSTTFMRNQFSELTFNYSISGNHQEIKNILSEFKKNYHHDYAIPAISINVLRRYDNAQEWQKWGLILKELTQLKDLWAPTLNQFAAYRIEQKKTKISLSVTDKKTAHIILNRPRSIDLNNLNPLTLKILGISKDNKISFSIAGKQLKARQKNEHIIINVPHDDNNQIPSAIDLIKNEKSLKDFETEPHSEKFPQLPALLSCNNDKIKLELVNYSGRELKNLTITYRFPLAYSPGILRKEINQLDPYVVYQDEIKLHTKSTDSQYFLGNHYFVGQLDFSFKNIQYRIYTDCSFDNLKLDPSYPLGGVSIMGPISSTVMTVHEILQKIRTEKMNINYDLTWTDFPGKWKLQEKIHQEPYMAPNVIKTLGEWKQDYRGGSYLLKTEVLSEQEQLVRFKFTKKAVRYIFLNGKETDLSQVKLMKGKNHLFILYNNEKLGVHPERTGIFFQIQNIKTGERIKNITFKAL